MVLMNADNNNKSLDRQDAEIDDRQSDHANRQYRNNNASGTLAERQNVGVFVEKSKTKYGSAFAASVNNNNNNAKRTGVGRSAKKNRQKQTANANAGPPIAFLTARQRRRIVGTWKSIADRRQFCQRVYVQVFLRKPSIKTLFPFRDVPIGQLKYNGDFHRQTSLFSSFLHNLINAVQANNDGQLGELCRNIGVRHAQLPWVDIAAEAWRLFGSVVLDCLEAHFPCGIDVIAGGTPSSLVSQLPLLGHWLRDAYRRAWCALVDRAIEQIVEAYLSYKTRQNTLMRCAVDALDRCRPARLAADYEQQAYEDDDDQMHLQLVIVTTPVETLESPTALLHSLDACCWTEPDFDRCSLTTTPADPAPLDDLRLGVMTSSASMPATACPTARKNVLRLNSLEDWDF